MLADILVGPIIRRLTPQQLVLWWVSPYECAGDLLCYLPDDLPASQSSSVIATPLNRDTLTSYRVGTKAVVHLLDVSINLPVDTYIEYDLRLKSADENTSGKHRASEEKKVKSLSETLPNLTYPDHTRPSFIIKQDISHLLHGSCRNPHHESQDSLLAGDVLVGESLTDCQSRPALLMLSGDQVYADHVAGITLYAIHQVIELLGLNDESFNDENITCQNLAAKGIHCSQELYQYQAQYFQRNLLLPTQQAASAWFRIAKDQPIFSSTDDDNHLMTFAENMAMYFLVWSPTLWQQVDLSDFNVPAKYEKRHKQELAAIEEFVQGLSKVQRLLAHIPTYMIFDDHDVTDDWNLTAAWEQAAYQDPLARRIIGNSLFAYWLCQAWGNDPKQFAGEFLANAELYQTNLEASGELSEKSKQQDKFIDYLLAFSHWHFTLDTFPKMVVLDSRTRRWRSESSLDSPSGLMDWEALCDLQQELIGHQAIILVAPAPIFGVKVIETIQRIATLAGKPLTVDAENWMAHPGAANTLLNIFRHPKTPEHFVILSGDVHYSFVYDIELRFREHSPKIWQVTSSGIKNQFPQPYIGFFDRLNRWLYGPNSLLNIFTKRRDMRIKGRKLEVNGEKKMLKLGHQRLSAKSALGYIILDKSGSPEVIADLHSDGSKTIFIETDEELVP